MGGWFSRISLRWKLASVTVLATTIALLISGVIMALYDARTYEGQKVGAITTEAKILAGSVAAALVFGDTDAALEYLTTLSANPEVIAAAAYDQEGSVAASYARPSSQSGGSTGAVPETVGPHGYRFEGGELEVFVPVTQDKMQIGSVYVKAIVEPVAARLARYTAILLLIGTGALALALPVSLWLHRLISNPLEELAARTAIIRTTMNAVDHGVLVVDKDMRVAFINDKVAKLFPDNSAAVEGEDIMARLRDSQEKYAKRAPADIAAMDLSGPLRGHYHLPDGRTLEYRQEPLPQGGFVRTYTDISEEKLLQERLENAKVKAEDAAMAKSQFLAAMSHEIRTPMSGVIGIVELLRSTTLNDEQKQMVELIQRSGVGLLDVINDILDYSKIEAGRMTVETTDCALAEIVETTAEVIGGHTQSKMLNIVCSIDPRIDPIVKGDPVRIRQVILNLMGNAVKFTEVGTVSIDATVESSSDERISVLFEVTDTGMGIPDDKQKQLFQAFSQADYSTTRKFGGTGLGLSISKNLIELMNGEIGVRSTPGQGSTFWFRVPFPRVPAAERAASMAEYEGLLTGLRVLVYDPTVPRSASGRYLQAGGAEVIAPITPEQVMTTLKQETGAGNAIDAVVVCVRIGDAKAVRLIEEINALPWNIKLIIIAPHLSAAAAKMATAQKPAAFLSAPIRRAKFYDALALATGRATQKKAVVTDVTIFNFEPPSVNEALAQGCLILVAEDNQTNQFVIKNQMRRLGFAAEFVNDGKEAWEAIIRNEGRYGLLITDCHMPYIDGYQLAGMIRDRELTSSGHLPVVALTANALQGEADICRAAGMDGYMFKPTDLATLDAMVQKWLPQAASLRKSLAPDADMAANNAAIEAQSANGAAIDTSVLASLLGSSDPAALKEMLMLYLETELDTPATLRALIAAKDGVGLAKVAHAAKGAASSAGAKRLRDLCKDIERNAAQEDWARMAHLSSQVDVAFADVRKFIEAF